MPRQICNSMAVFAVTVCSVFTISEFKQYKKNYQKERDIEIDDTFETAATAIKRRATGTMTTIKLDKNFDINIHGGEQYIVRGYDEERGMYYYQLFFKEEK